MVRALESIGEEFERFQRQWDDETGQPNSRIDDLEEEVSKLERELEELKQGTDEPDTDWERLREETGVPAEIERYLRTYKLLTRYSIALTTAVIGSVTGAATAEILDSESRPDVSQTEPGTTDSAGISASKAKCISSGQDRYSTPPKGATDWHAPLNNNFETLDRDVPIRGSEDDLSQYDPVEGAQFTACDTGNVFVGNGSEWIKIGKFVSEARIKELEQRLTRLEER